jgi:mono/diheme cytochrome c family protein
VFAILAAGTTLAAEPTNSPGFQHDILPILEQHCSQCHAPGRVGFQAIGLDLTNYHAVMAGSRHGQSVIPRQPQMSPLVKVLDWSKDTYPHMPANEHELSKQDIDAIGAWIAAGAKDD